jgi:hypothetical protein
VDKVNYTFPSLTVAEKDKDENWHQGYVQAIVNRSMAEGYSDRYAIANECVNFYLSLQTGAEFDFLQKAEDGDILPAKWMTYSRINNKINLMLGELSAKKYEIKVKGLNEELTSRKLKEREKRRIDLRFEPVAQELEQAGGMPLQGPPTPIQNGFIPENEQELDDFFETSYKDIAEIVVKAILKYLAKVNNWDYQRLSIFRDILIMGMGFCCTELIDGIPITRRIDPRNMVWDVNSTDDFLSDSTYFGEISYMNVGDAINKFNLTKKQIEEVYGSYQNDLLSAQSGNFTPNSSIGINGSSRSMRFFKQESGELRVLVAKAVWVDYKPYNYKSSTDKYGQEHIKRMDADSQEKEVKRTQIKTWRQGTLIGGKILKDWGEIPNQARDWTTLSYCDCPYKAIIPNYMNGAVVSKVRLMQDLQNLKDIALYRLQLDMARAGTKSFVYDINMLPPGFTVEKMLKYTRSAGVMLVDSTAGQPSNFNQLRDVDQTISNNITAYLTIAEMIDREMDGITGINEARQGMVKNASQAVGVTQSALFQSSLSTAMYYDMFSQFASKVLSYQTKLAKIAWAGNERFSTIIGDDGIDFLAMDVDMDLNDYAVFVEEIPPLVQDEQTYQQLIIAGLQSGQVTLIQALELIMEEDIQVGIRKLKRETKKMQQEQMQQQQAEMQAQQESEQAALQAQSQEANADRQVKLGVQQMNNQGALQQVAAKGRADLRGKLIDFKESLVLAKLQKELEKTKQAAKDTGN